MNKKYFSLILAFVIGVILTSMAFLLFKSPTAVESKYITETITTTDTITKVDTIYRTITIPQYITETIIRTDTIKQDTILPYISREYLTHINNDSISGTIKATVSGYNAALDTLQYNLYIPTKTITNTVNITKYKHKHWNFTVGVGLGYGVIHQQGDVFIGGMVGYSF